MTDVAPDLPVLDPATRPVAPPGESAPFSERGEAVRRHFRAVHEKYRAEMREVLDALGSVSRSAESIGRVRAGLQRLALRADDWALGGICQRQCLSLTEHHGLEDHGIFPHLRRSRPELGSVLDRLDDEHLVVHDLLERIDAALVELVRHPGEHETITALLHRLSETILSHFAYEEDQLLEPLGRFGFARGQV